MPVELIGGACDGYVVPAWPCNDEGRPFASASFPGPAGRGSAKAKYFLCKGFKTALADGVDDRNHERLLEASG